MYIKPFSWRPESKILTLTNKSNIYNLIEPELNHFNHQDLRRVEGVGNQMLDVIDSKSDLTFDPTPAKMGWEMCAPEVLL